MNDEVLYLRLTRMEMITLIQRLGVEEVIRELIDENELDLYRCQQNGMDGSAHEKRIAELKFAQGEAEELPSDKVHIVFPRA